MKVLSNNPYDIPLAGCYLFSNSETDRASNLIFASSFGLSSSKNANRVLPPTISLASEDQLDDQLSKVIREVHLTKQHQIVDISKYEIGQIPPWQDEPRLVVVLPLTTNRGTTTEPDVVDNFGVLVLGVNTRRELDEAYLTFFKLVASQTTGSMMTAYRHEEAKKKAEALAELDRAKTLFFTNISHELRTYESFFF